MTQLTVTFNKEPAISGGSMCSLRPRRSAVHRLPSFQQSTISGFPVSQCRRDSDARLKIEGERRLVLKLNVHSVIIRGDRQFNIGNDLASGLREPVVAGNFILSQLRPPVVRLVRAAFVRKHECGPLPFIAGVGAFSSGEFKLG